MDLLQIIKLISIPKWVKFSSLTIIFCFMGLAIYVIFGGAQLAHDGGILQAGMGLLGVLLPLSVAIVFLTFYEAGVAPLKKATEKVLTQLIPEVLVCLGRDKENAPEPTSVVTTPLLDYICRYLIKLPDKRELQLDVQLNVRKVSVVFYFPERKGRCRIACFSEFERLFEHTLAGARHEGYAANNVVGHTRIEDRCCDNLVLYKTLPRDFLWNSAEKLYFAQDMQVMVESLIQEADALLMPDEKIKD